MSSIISVGYEILLFRVQPRLLPSREAHSIEIQKFMVRVDEFPKLKSDYVMLHK